MMNLDEAFLNISLRLPVEDSTVKQRLDRAYAIVDTLGHNGYAVQYPLLPGGAYLVSKLSTGILTSDADSQYTVTPGSCTCPDAESRARAGLCKHRLAIMLLEEMQRDV